MPWTLADVERHKKNLDDTQKKKWVRMANAIFSDCLKRKDKGGFETCKAKAVIISNSKTKTPEQKQESSLLDVYLSKTQGDNNG